MARCTRGIRIPFTLLIDIKSDAVATYLALHRELRRHQQILTRFTPGVARLRDATPQARSAPREPLPVHAGRGLRDRLRCKDEHRPGVDHSRAARMIFPRARGNDENLVLQRPNMGRRACFSVSIDATLAST